MIGLPARAMPVVSRLVAGLAARRPDLASSAALTRVLCLDVDGRPPAWDAADRLLVIGWIGTHRDAADARLRAAWELEERARESAAPALVLRLAPVVAADEPLWRRLGTRPRLGRRARRPLQPVLRDDVLETIERACDGRAAWDGWFEVCGGDVLTLGEMAALAAASAAGARSARVAGAVSPAVAGAGAWEPPLEVLDEQPLAEPEPWRRHFGLTPARVVEWARRAA